MRPEFIIDMYKELKQIQKEEISNKELHVIINDMRKFLQSEKEDYETNQYYLGMK